MKKSSLVFFVSLIVLISFLVVPNELVLIPTVKGATTWATFSETSDAMDGWGKWQGSEYQTNGGVNVGDYINDGRIDYRASQTFTNITIPPGTTIFQAYVEFYVYLINTQGPDDVVIYCHDVDDSHAILNNGWVDWHSRTNTTASVSDDWSGWTLNNKHNTSDLSSIIQEIIDRPGWSSGNNITFLYHDDWGYDEQERVGTQDFSLANPPVLYIEYGYVDPSDEAVQTGFDDTDNMYAMKQYYWFNVSLDWVGGANQFENVTMRARTSMNTTLWGVSANNLTGLPNWDISTNSSIIDLDTSSASWSENGINGTARFPVRAEWDHPEYDDLNLDVWFELANGSTSDWESLATSHFDVISTLTTTGLTTSDGRIDRGGTTYVYGYVRYPTTVGGTTSSTSYPPNAQFTVIEIQNATHFEHGNDTTIVNGLFNASTTIPDEVQLNTYHVFLNISDDYTDADAPDGDTVTIIGDEITILTLATTDANIGPGETTTLYSTAELAYDNTALGVGDVLNLEGYFFSWDAVDSRFEHTFSESTTGTYVIDTYTSGTETFHGITEGDINGQSVTITVSNYTYNFYGPYYENGTLSTNTTIVTIYFVNGTQDSFTLSTSHTYNATSQVRNFGWNVSKDEVDKRYYYPLISGIDVYVFIPLETDTYDTYTFTIQDYVGKLGLGDAHLESLLMVNSTNMIIERKLIPVTPKQVSLILVEGTCYTLRIRYADGSYYYYGAFCAGDDTTETISITELEVTDELQLVYEYITVDAQRPNGTHIWMSYLDESPSPYYTTQVNFTVEYRNGSTAYHTYALNVSSITFNWYSANASTDYIVRLWADHTFFGEITHAWLFDVAGSYTSFPDFELFGTWGNVDANNLIAVFIALIVMGTCSFVSVGVAPFLGVTTLGFLTMLGFADFTTAQLTYGVVFSVIAGVVLGMARRN